MAPLPQTSSDTEALVLAHRRLARSLAQRYVRAGEQREDLEQVAYLGLVKAARRFDPDRGVAFTSFAMPTILGELRRFCRDTRWAVHVPREIQERVQALRRFEDDHQIRHGRSPSTAEAAAELGWSQEDVLEARMAAGCLSPQSLNATLRSADGTVGEAIECIGAEDTALADAERRDELQEALARLTRAERHALRLRGEDGCATPEIARRMGLTPSQASRLVAGAVRHLRAALAGDRTPPVARDEPYVSLADADPQLFAGLDAKTLLKARVVRARRLTLAPGRWRGPRSSTDGLGLLVLNGTLLRTVTLNGKPRAELLGAGDLLRAADEAPALPVRAAWRVLEPVELAVVDESLLNTLCQWSPVVDVLLRRASARSHALAVQLAIGDLRRAEDRLLALFGVLAERWGRRGADGVSVAVPLTHDVIAMLVGVHRPTVTSALRGLEREGRLRRVTRDRWLLGGGQRSPALVLAA